MSRPYDHCTKRGCARAFEKRALLRGRHRGYSCSHHTKHDTLQLPKKQRWRSNDEEWDNALMLRGCRSGSCVSLYKIIGQEVMKSWFHEIAKSWIMISWTFFKTWCLGKMKPWNQEAKKLVYLKAIALQWSTSEVRLSLVKSWNLICSRFYNAWLQRWFWSWALSFWKSFLSFKRERNQGQNVSLHENLTEDTERRTWRSMRCTEAKLQLEGMLWKHDV